MDAKEAISAAKRHVSELFGDEKVTNLGLEGITRYSPENWEVVIGFSRPWDNVMDAQSIITGLARTERVKKQVMIRDSDGGLVWIRDQA